MTRDELREKVAYGICKSLNGNQHHNLKYLFDKEKYVDAANSAIDTIFAALKEPSEEMKNAAIDVDAFKLGDISPLGFRISPQQLFLMCWQAMLSASPLAPKGE